MTLILGAAANQKFVTMSSDTRRVTKYFWRDCETGVLTPVDLPIEKQEGRFLKVVKVSDYVLLGVAGVATAADFIKEAMQKFVLPSDDLAACKKKLNFIINQGRNDPTFRYRSLLLQKGVSAVLLGFHYNGDTGNISYDSGEEIDIGETRTNDIYNWQYCLLTPVEKYKSVIGELFDMPFHKRTKKVENIKKLKWIHKLISNAHPVEVSNDGVIYTITRKPDGSMKYSESEFQVPIDNGAMS